MVMILIMMILINYDDDFGADVGTLAKAPKLIMKIFYDVVD